MNEEKNSLENDPKYILSGPCRGCKNEFRCIRQHLAKAPFCVGAYDMEELKRAATEQTRLLKKVRHEKCRDEQSVKKKQHYLDNKDYYTKKNRTYNQKNKDRRHQKYIIKKKEQSCLD